MKRTLTILVLALTLGGTGYAFASPVKQVALTKSPLVVKPAAAKKVKRIHHPLLLKVKRAKLHQKVKLQHKQFDLSGALKAPR